MRECFERTMAAVMKASEDPGVQKVLEEFSWDVRRIELGLERAILRHKLRCQERIRELRCDNVALPKIDELGELTNKARSLFEEAMLCLIEDGDTAKLWNLKNGLIWEKFQEVVYAIKLADHARMAEVLKIAEDALSVRVTKHAAETLAIQEDEASLVRRKAELAAMCRDVIGPALT